MSSMVASHRIPSTVDWPLGCVGGAPTRSTFDNFEERRERTWQKIFDKGLPTPPSTGAMTGPDLSHALPNDIVPPAYNLSTYPSQDVSTVGGLTSNRNIYSNDGLSNRLTQHLNGHGAGSSEYFQQEAKETSSDSIASCLQIPESVNNSKGSLAEFAAELTCLFWFETSATIQCAEGSLSTRTFGYGLVADAIPSIGFRKWVTTILATTLVGKNVVLLALLFIYRLKKFNPGVSGKRGSEFRLLTIALMLGNKFLDDNTYTNKTWAEVSGISVNEIHIMEVEFLSNMRYNLYVSQEEWRKWQIKLGKFGAFYRHASRVPSTDVTVKASTPITPMSLSPSVRLPSPPMTNHGGFLYQPSESRTNYASQPHPFSAAPVLPRSPLRQHPEPFYDRLVRKRSIDTSTDVPAAKRVLHSHLPSGPFHTPASTIQTPGRLPAHTSGLGTLSPMTTKTRESSRTSRLPMPKIQTTPNEPGSSNLNHLAPISLPSTRAMSTVYSNPSSSWYQPITPVTTAHSTGLNLYSSPIPSLHVNTRSHSNYASANASPAMANHFSGTPTRPGLSPSFFLTNRSSPYRPVRGVNTLLFPPPSTSLHNPSRSIDHDQIHYQPLSKNSMERRTGVVPYLQPDSLSHPIPGRPIAQSHYSHQP